MSAKAIVVASILLAAALRFTDLGARPMHTDESVHADKFGTLLETGSYAYDPAEYHGPSLYYMTLPSAWLRGQARYVEIDETTLRSLPAVLGVVLVAAHVGARSFLGAPGAAVAALLAALSPAMVFYGRYYIHETPLVLFSFGTLLAGIRYSRRPGALVAVLAGTCAGLMHATKETAPLALGAMFAALVLTRLAERRRAPMLPAGSSVRGRDALLGLLAAFAVSSVLFTSFLTRPEGVVDSLRTYGLYLDRANAAAWHHHPWDYYLQLLVHFPADGTPLWSEALILALALCGAAAGWSARGVPGADQQVLRFLAFYTLVMVVAYAAIPYKTPWCLLGFLHGMILLAGTGAVFLVRLPRSPAARGLMAALLVAAAGQLGWQAWSGSFRFAADPRNPYVYAHTGTDVFTIAQRLGELARAHPDGKAMPLQVVSRENLWPLPWYLREFSRVAWWNGVSDAAPSAPVILATPEMRSALVRKLYDLPPPGERELYVSIFEEPVELRPQLELRGYATAALWDAARRRDAGRGTPAPTPR